MSKHQARKIENNEAGSITRRGQIVGLAGTALALTAGIAVSKAESHSYMSENSSLFNKFISEPLPAGLGIRIDPTAQLLTYPSFDPSNPGAQNTSPVQPTQDGLEANAGWLLRDPTQGVNGHVWVAIRTGEAPNDISFVDATANKDAVTVDGVNAESFLDGYPNPESSKDSNNITFDHGTFVLHTANGQNVAVGIAKPIPISD